MQIAAIYRPVLAWSVGRGGDAGGRRWALTCAGVAATLAALLHHGWFYRTTCMLNHFGADYSHPDVLARWLTHDPSLLLGIVLAVAVWAVGARAPRLRPLALPFVLAFLPLSLWVWDIPFAGRPICAAFHDGQVPLRGLHLWAFGGLGYPLLAWSALRRDRLARRSPPVAGELAPAA